jgi:hypothetical protein
VQVCEDFVGNDVEKSEEENIVEVVVDTGASVVRM